jgi:hypothetical protein
MEQLLLLDQNAEIKEIAGPGMLMEYVNLYVERGFASRR